MPPEARLEYHAANATRRRELLVRSGRNPDAFEDGQSRESFVPYVGHGTGGSTSLYGMVLERRYPHDFEDWPVQYEHLAPWYARAEKLYGVTGSADPLRTTGEPGCPEPATPLSDANSTMFAHFERTGLHPYRLHLASRRVPNCVACQGYLCDSREPCKNDARVTCLAPALKTGNARLYADTRVVRFESDGRRVTAAVAETKGEEIRLTARLYALAAGALSTPQILLNSRLANRSGLVGRRLMRHAIDLFVLTLAPRYRKPVESKELGLNDYYARPGDWLGTVQSFGMAPPIGYLRNQPGRNVWKMLGPAATAVSRLFQNAPIVASILEDKPVPENCVEAGQTGGRIQYRLAAADAARRAQLRRAVLRALIRFGPVPVLGTSERGALGHACGTAVFGNDPATSVLNAHNRSHDIGNLYVVDGSFFPTSGGVNPALTIIANALRVADQIDREVL
jgi:choline dehydrogenase-like flavoprotein